MPKFNRSDIINIIPVYERFDSRNGLRLLTLTIYERTEPLYRKVLIPGKFSFITASNETEEKDGESKAIIDANLYGKNISVQAVVGENGSGKSSLLDMIYRIINNFSYYLMHELKYTDAARPLAYVKGIYAKIDYELDSQLYSVECRGDELALITPDKKYRVGLDNEEEWGDYEDVTGAKSDKVREVMKSFFYTIVTNYSFNAFLSSDYSQDHAIGLQGTSWIDSLFNKNDGYRTPIVLNPYRSNGQLDVQKETNFAVSRTIAILEFYKQKKWQFIDGYRLHDILYLYNPHSFLAQFRGTLSPEERDTLRKIGETQPPEVEREKYEFIIKKKFADALSHSASYATLILSEYDIKPEMDNEVHFMACCYLVYKVFSILENYPVYSKYEEYGNIRNCFEIQGSKEHHQLEECADIFPEIIAELEKDKSHITYKLRLTLQFLRNQSSRNFASWHNENGFNLGRYKGLFCNENPQGNLERVMESFPMPLFKPEILLDKVDEKGNPTERESVHFTALSSGEKLFTYTLSSIIYHILNIKSVPSSRIHYRRMNIVMDELELCFHPEMQRKFIRKLITTIEHLHLNTHCKFNFLLVTHSPFILSDIPSDRILFLRDGKDVREDVNINPFATNINEVLSNNFFLSEKGFLGDNAQKWINSILDFLQNGKNKDQFWSRQRASYFIDNIIGDPFIKEWLGDILKNNDHR